MTSSSPLLDQVRTLLASALDASSGSPAREPIQNLAQRLDEPLRVAIAGKVKAGKSTLLNALVGQELAPTDAGECTKIVTWYRDGATYRATIYPKDGEPRQVPFSQDGGAIEVDLQGRSAEELERLVIDWPSASLRAMSVIDTPGIASISTDVSARAHAFLVEQEQPTASDAVLYLMRHLHSTDVSFLEAFHDREAAHPTPINTIAVLSRADEVGVGKLDAMATAERIAARYRHHPKVRRLCQTVVPVAGLIAQAGATLREEEYRALASIANASETDVTALLLSVDRFLAGVAGIAVATTERENLMRRLGMFGIRYSVAMIRKKTVTNAKQLAADLFNVSGLPALRETLSSQFAARRDALKARAALLGLEAILRHGVVPASDRLMAEVERVQGGAHEFTELRLLNLLRSDTLGLREEEIEEAERLLGAAGTDPAARLGLAAETSPDQMLPELQAVMGRWQFRAENPLSSREAAAAARVLVRTCEGLFAELRPRSLATP
jgi:hypothetical protein